jgi:hypothetical protein
MRRLAKLTDIVLEDHVTYESAGPSHVQHVLLGDERSSILEQQPENRKRVGPHRWSHVCPAIGFRNREDAEDAVSDRILIRFKRPLLATRPGLPHVRGGARLREWL